MRNSNGTGQSLVGFDFVEPPVLRSPSKLKPLVILANGFGKGLRSMFSLNTQLLRGGKPETVDTQDSTIGKVYFPPKGLAIIHVYWLLSDSAGVEGDVLK